MQITSDRPDGNIYVLLNYRTFIINVLVYRTGYLKDDCSRPLFTRARRAELLSPTGLQFRSELLVQTMWARDDGRRGKSSPREPDLDF